MWRDSETDQDFLSFSEVAEQITTLVTDPTLLPISVGVFGGWGTGKSTILRLTENRLSQSQAEGTLVVKFDAWLYQGFDDARAALMEVVSTAILEEAERKKTLIDKAKDFAGRVNYFRALGTIADFGVGIALGVPPGLLTGAGSLVSSFLSGKGSLEEVNAMTGKAKATTDGLSSLIRPTEKRTPPKEIAAFRNEFGELLEGLDTMLVVFIDNLDRCLPDVAIATLESVHLFLFIPRTSFVIAADESMIRHSVAKHFHDPQTSHVRDYLDKVIQVPMRVPRVGADELRAYMYSLFVQLTAPKSLPAVQERLSQRLQIWKGESFERSEIGELAGNDAQLLDNLAIADRLAPILATAPEVQGNPRIVKRLLNSIFLRRRLAENRGMTVNIATLAKIAVFERCTNDSATSVLYRIAMDSKNGYRQLMPAEQLEGEPPEFPTEWQLYTDFVVQWREMEPLFDKDVDLRPAVFLSRDVMAPAWSRTEISAAGREAAAGLLKIDSVLSPVGKKIAADVSATDQLLIMDRLIDAMRQADWSKLVPGLHGAILLSKEARETQETLKAFVSGLPSKNIDKGMKYLLTQSGLLENS